MKFSDTYSDQITPISDLFERTFAHSEGKEEGRLIGNLAKNLMETTPSSEIHVFTVSIEGELSGAIIFTRIHYDEDPLTAYLLSPVAIAPQMQGQGCGQKLLRHGLDSLRAEGADIAITYGDPNYYAKVGFSPISEDTARPPLKLSYPNGWLAQSLKDEKLIALAGPSRCAPALDDPAYW